MDENEKLWNIEMNNKFQLSQEGLTGSEEKADRTKITMSNIDGRKILDYSVGRGFMIGISECTDSMRMRKKTKSEPHDIGLKPARSSSKKKKSPPPKQPEVDLEQVMDGLGRFEGRVDGWMKKNAKLEKDYSDLKRRLDEEEEWKENRRKDQDLEEKHAALDTRPHTSNSNLRRNKEEALSTLKETLHYNREEPKTKASNPAPSHLQSYHADQFKTVARPCGKCEELARQLRQEREERGARDREEEELHSLTGEFKKEMNLLVEENRRLKEELERSSRREADLMRDVERVQADQERLKQNDFAHVSSQKKLLEEADRLKDRLSDAHREAARLKEDLSLKASKLYSAEADLAALRLRLEQLEAEAQEARRKEEDLLKYQQALKQQLDTTFQQSMDPVPTFGLNSANNRQLTFNPRDQPRGEEPASKRTKSSRLYQDDFIDMKEFKHSARSSGGRDRSQQSRSTDKPFRVPAIAEPYPPYSHGLQPPVARFHSSVPPHLIDDFAKSSKILLNVFNDTSEMTGDAAMCEDKEEIKVLEERLNQLELKNSLNN